MTNSDLRFDRMKHVLFVTRILTQYRVPFHIAVREKLRERGVEYHLAYGTPTPDEKIKGDLASLPWAEVTKTYYLGSERLVWQKLRLEPHLDLIILGQENRNLVNYRLQIARFFGGPRLAFFGHGRNFQSNEPDSIKEKFKRFWLSKVDWWFAYTQNAAKDIALSGFPASSITVFNNTIDTSAIRDELASINAEETAALRMSLCDGSINVGVYIGGLYPLKRIPFLLEAARHIKSIVPDFHLIIVGGGTEAPLINEAAKASSWIHPLGPKFGREKTLVASLGKIFLMPGLVGLGIVDSFAYKLPMIATKLPYHSPEIEYLENGVNGIIIQDCNDVGEFAQEAARLLNDAEWHSKLVAGTIVSLEKYSLASMATYFADGVMSVLNKKR